MKDFIIALLVSIWIHHGFTQIATFDVRLGNLYLMQRGLGSPYELRVAKGHEALLKLNRELVNQQSCSVTTPKGVTFDVRQPPQNRYESWSDGCGVRVRNIIKEDEGRWRLTATRGNYSITGWSEVHVQDEIPEYHPTPIALQDGERHAHVDLTTLNSAYCLVEQPFSDISFVPGHCSVTLDRTTRAVQGNWNVVLGLPGQVAEVQANTKVEVEVESLDTGYVQDTNAKKLHLYCNILHTQKNITFCRFQKITEHVGYNIMNGLSDGAHSYYGDGFEMRHCGMTVENPTEQVFGTWRCTVGVQERVGTQIHQRTPMQALIRVSPYNLGSRIMNEVNEDSIASRTIFVQRDMGFTITCRAEVSLSYCWFQHPNGTQYTPVPRSDDSDDSLFWYAGESLQTGDCGISFSYATDEDSGEWTCHMGPRRQMGVELTDKLVVRVTGPLAASQKEIPTVIDGSATLFCKTSNGNRPLEYCRFLSPKFVGISIDPSVTKENAILGRYFFTTGRDLDYGDCSLTIISVTNDDLGEWTCAALLHDEAAESRDIMTLYVEQRSSVRFRADILGMAGGVVLLAVVLICVLWYKREKIRSYWKKTDSSSRTDNVSLQTFSAASWRKDSDSSGSANGSQKAGSRDIS
ncbi:uncharacterized protein LOC105841933 [Bombyx mori]|uniref:Immunoglobulin domain-containing protein n=1 Tax=Bombyx mori TaxID=7091 RepID=A0A8R2C6S3_BOMMO|nr:uncharacterized protein LOC105841933 [Bombyx mori]